MTNEHLQPHMKLIDTLRKRMESGTPNPNQSRELPVTLYTDPKSIESERAKAFRIRPVIVGHASSIPCPGDHFTHDLLGTPLLITRGHDGEVRAFLNVCRHRGMRLVGSPNTKRRVPSFVCPYHHWAFDLDGRLINVPLEGAFDGTDLSCRNLKSIYCTEHRGFIWVQVEGEPFNDVQSWLGNIDSDFQAFQVEDHVVVKQTQSTKKANWKLIIEAFEDGYHVVRLHKKTVGPFFNDGQSISTRVGEHIRGVVARKEFSQIFNAPTNQWDARRHVSFAYYIFPNTIIVVHPDYISHLGVFPQSVDETCITHTFLARTKPETDAENDHISRSFDLIENGVFQSEDYFVCEGIQAGLSSGANDTVVTGSHEIGVMLFHDILAEALNDGCQAKPA